MASPARFFNGVTVDNPTGILGQIGQINPFFNHMFANDFDAFSTQQFTTTALSTGTAAINPSFDGGAVTLTTAATNADTVAFQTKSAAFALVPATSSVAGKKTAFMARVRLDDVTLGGFIVGLMPITTTAFAPADGIYITKPTGGTVLNLVSRVGGTSTTVAFPTTSYTLANATDIDVGWYYDGKGNLQGFVGTNTQGYSITSGTGTTLANRGAVVAMQPTVTAVNMTPTVGLQAGSGVVRTLNCDMIMAVRER